MRHKKKYRPYVRRANGKEQSTSLRMAVRLAYYRLQGRPFYVMVQRGFPRLVMEVGRCKREVQQTPVTVACGDKTFRQWANYVHSYASAQKVKGGQTA